MSELHNNYKKALTAFTTYYPDATTGLMDDIDSYYRACALLVWAEGPLSEHECASLLGEIYLRDNAKQLFSVDDVRSAKEFLQASKYSVPVPTFFRELVSYDESNNTSFSRRFAEGMRFILAVFSKTDEAATLDERCKNRINAIYESLIAVCNDAGVRKYEPKVKFETLTASTSATQERANRRKDDYPPKPTIAQNNQQDGMTRLNELVGLQSVKEEVRKINNYIKIQKMREDASLPSTAMSYHLVFTGNPGTGKTTVARIIAQIYRELGVLSKGHLIETDRSGLVAGYMGQTAVKTHELIESAKGGVLFIDEAYALAGSYENDYGKEAIDTLIKGMEDNRNDLVVIVAGYKEPMRRFIDSNPGLESRFNRFIEFPDYTGGEMLEIFLRYASRDKYTLDDSVKKALLDYYTELYNNRTEEFANGRLVRNHFERTITNQASRLANSDTVSSQMLTEITIDDLGISSNDVDPVEVAMDELNHLIGLHEVKDKINDMVNLIRAQQARREQGLLTTSISMHLVFTGNPGTGKTTVARLIGRIYRSLGILSKGQLIETDRSGLVAGYVGQTAIKTKDVIKSAEGGVLFIDEAYTLATDSNNDFGQEAIDTLLKAMEDKRNNMVVIVAGYPDLMDKFINSNPGLESRFNQYIHFPDYSAAEMTELFSNLCKDNQYSLEEGALELFTDLINREDPAEIGNGRGVRNIFEKSIIEQANRLAVGHNEEADYQLLMREDVANAFLN